MYWVVPHFFDIMNNIPGKIIQLSNSDLIKNNDEKLTSFSKYLSKMLYAIYDKGADISKLISKIDVYYSKEDNIIIESLKYVLGSKYITEKNIIFYEETSLCIVKAESTDNYYEYIKSQMELAPVHVSAIIYFPSASKSIKINDLIKHINAYKHYKVRGILCYDKKNNPIMIKRSTFIYSVYTNFNTSSVLSDELILIPSVIYIEQIDCTNCKCHCNEHNGNKKIKYDDSSSSSESPKRKNKHKLHMNTMIPYGNQTIFIPDNLVFTFLPYLERIIFQVFKIPSMENIRPLLFNSAKGIIQIIYQYIPETYSTSNFVIGRQKRFNKKS